MRVDEPLALLLLSAASVRSQRTQSVATSSKESLDCIKVQAPDPAGVKRSLVEGAAVGAA